MKLQVVEVAIETVKVLRPVLLRIRREDPALFRQVRDALNSTVLNLTEGEYNDVGTRKSRFHTACGSCNEARGGVRLAQAWGYVSPSACEPGLVLLDRVIATLWKLLH